MSVDSLLKNIDSKSFNVLYLEEETTHDAVQGKKISCPTCRARTKVADVAYVDNGRGHIEGDEGQASSSAAQEAAIQVEGSYGTKVRPTVGCYHSVVVCERTYKGVDPACVFLNKGPIHQIQTLATLH